MCSRQVGANPRCGAPLGRCQGGEHGSESRGEGRQVCGDALRGRFQLSPPLPPAAAGCSLSPGSAQTLLCSPASAASAGVGTATSTPSTLQPLLQHGDNHQDTATLLPRKLQPSPALALQQPFDPRCSNAAEDAFCTGPRAVCRPNPPQIFEREATEKAGYGSAQ